MLDPIRVQVLQLDLIVVQQTPKERVGRNHESMLVEGREETTLPSGGTDASSRPGMSHSTTSVLPWRRPHLTSPSMHAWVTSEWYHESMEDGGSWGKTMAVAEKQKL